MKTNLKHTVETKMNVYLSFKLRAETSQSYICFHHIIWNDEEGGEEGDDSNGATKMRNKSRKRPTNGFTAPELARSSCANPYLSAAAAAAEAEV